MNILLDTHVFVWMDIAPKRLSAAAQQAITDLEHILFISMASIWEIQIKTQLGKLQLNNDVGETLERQRQTNGLRILPIHLAHVLALGSLPDHHHDPFERLIVAQAQVENLILLTNDEKIRRYNVTWLW